MNNAGTSISMQILCRNFSLFPWEISFVMKWLGQHILIFQSFWWHHKIVYPKVCTTLHSCQAYMGMPTPLHTLWDLSCACSSLSFSSHWIVLSLLPLFLIFSNFKVHSPSHCHVHKNIPNSFHERALQSGGPSLENLDQSVVPVRLVLVLVFSLHSHYRFAVGAHHAKGSGRKLLS